jgi:hypothetical protein
VRRRGRRSVLPPERLCRFVLSEWPGFAHEAEAFSEYMGARFGWYLEHPDDPLPGDPREEALTRRFRGEQ